MATEINAFIPEDSSPILISYINSIATIKRAEVVEITLLPSIPYYRVLGRVVRKLRISILKEALLIFSQHHPHVTIITSDTVVKDIDSPEEKVTARPSDLLYEKAYDGLLGLSTYSTLVTEYSRSEMAPPRRWKKIAEDIRENFLHSYLDTKNWVKQNSPNDSTLVIVSNGRFSNQAGCIAALRESSLEYQVLENGGQRGKTFWLQSFPPNDRVKFQMNYINNHSNDYSEAVNAAFLVDINEVHPSSWGFTSNLRLFEVPKSEAAKGLRIVYFSSSPDEFVGLGESWTSSIFATQDDALLELNDLASKQGHEILLRMHPNLMNKPWREFLRASRMARSLTKHVIYPFESFSASSVVRCSDIVVTWGSSVGLEACAAGKPVYLLGPSHYDLVADVRGWLDLIQTPSEFLCFEPNSISAKKYLKYLANYGDLVEQVLLSNEMQRLEVRRIKMERLTNRFFAISVALDRPAPVLRILIALVGETRTRGIFDWLLRFKAFR